MSLMKYPYWILISVLFIGGIGVSVYYGTLPKPIPKIDFSQFENPEKLGVAIAARMQMDLSQSRLLLLGVMPDHSEDILVWKSFLSKVTEAGLKYDITVIEPKLPHKGMINYQEEMDLKVDLERFVTGLQRILEQNSRVVVILPSIYASQLLKGNPADRLKTEFNIEPMSFSVAHLPLTREQEATQEIPCNVEQGDHDGTGALGCAIVSKARTVYRKKKMPDRYVGLMDQVGAKDYLILLGRTEK